MQVRMNTTIPLGQRHGGFMRLKVNILQMTRGEGFFRGLKLIVERAGTVRGICNFLFCPRNLALQKMIRKGTGVQKV